MLKQIFIAQKFLIKNTVGAKSMNPVDIEL